MLPNGGHLAATLLGAARSQPPGPYPSRSMPASPPPDTTALEHTDLLGLRLAQVTTAQMLDHMFASLERRQGGWLLTANLDILRRFAHDPDARELYAQADVAVADGMPLVWASAVAGKPLPERVAGSSMVWDIAARAAGSGRRMYFLGGAPGAAEGAKAELQGRCPGLDVCGLASPMVSAVPTQDELIALTQDVVQSQPDIVLVAFGSPKQEYVIRHLRPHLPNAWMIGVGISLSFVTGQTQRAPLWMQKSGLEWVHRMAQEPGRLAKRYLLHDIPFAVELLARSSWQRYRT